MDITFLTASQGTAQTRPTAGSNTSAATDGEGFAQQLAKLGNKSNATGESGRNESGKPVTEPTQELPEEDMDNALVTLADLGVLVVQVPGEPGHEQAAPAGDALAEPADAADDSLPYLAEITQRMALMDNAGKLQPMNTADATKASAVSAIALAEPLKSGQQTRLRAQGQPVTDQQDQSLLQKPDLLQARPTTARGEQQQAEQPITESLAARLPTTTAPAMQSMPPQPDTGLPPLRGNAETMVTGDNSINAGSAMTGPALTPAAGAQSNLTPTTTATLSAPVATPAWQQQLGQQLVGLAMRRDQSMELHLNPAELGPLQVSLKLAELGAQAHFVSAHAPVRQAIEQAIPQLREALAEQGISLGETSVGEQGSQQAQSFAREQHGRQSSFGTQVDATASAVIPADVPLRPLTLDGRVDLYA